MDNLAKLIRSASATNPAAPFGTFREHDRLERVLERARTVADQLRSAGLSRGQLVTLIGPNSASYLIAWLAGQELGLQLSLVNPAYPDAFLGRMLDDLMPEAILWVGRQPDGLDERAILQLDLSGAWGGRVVLLREGVVASAKDGGRGGSGLESRPEEIAAYLHTSGTSGNPKFCALSHEYFLRLGRYFADVMAFSSHDVIHNPLPLFHINPMGNGVMGALSASAGFLSSDVFSAPGFWPHVKQHRVTALILHGPPANLLMKKTTPEEAHGHTVRIGFACSPDFLQRFGVGLGVGGYGSTEAGGFCHSWKFRPGDRDLPHEGATHLAGQPRFDLDCALADDGEILVREKAPRVLFTGYAKDRRIDPSRDADGWFHTGDRGRLDQYGNLIFLERMSESIRVNAEYVPIDLVEERLRAVESLQDFALWRIDSPSRGHEAVIYTTSRQLDLEQVFAALADLPRYMHPVQVIEIEVIPRDAGVGKVQRRRLGEQPVRAVHEVGERGRRSRSAASHAPSGSPRGQA